MENARLSVKVLGLGREFEGGKRSVHNETEKEGSVVRAMQRLRRRDV